MNINPYLIARLYTIQAAFAQPGFVGSFVGNSNASAKVAATPFNWDDLVIKDEDDQGGGSGGTIKGLRGKNHVAGKAAMRRLGRK